MPHQLIIWGMPELCMHVGVFGPLAVAGLAHAKGPRRIHKVMGLALNPPASAVHVLWAGIGLAFLSKEGK